MSSDRPVRRNECARRDTQIWTRDRERNRKLPPPAFEPRPPFVSRTLTLPASLPVRLSPSPFAISQERPIPGSSGPAAEQKQQLERAAVRRASACLGHGTGDAGDAASTWNPHPIAQERRVAYLQSAWGLSGCKASARGAPQSIHTCAARTSPRSVVCQPSFHREIDAFLVPRISYPHTVSFMKCPWTLVPSFLTKSRTVLLINLHIQVTLNPPNDPAKQNVRAWQYDKVGTSTYDYAFETEIMSAERENRMRSMSL